MILVKHADFLVFILKDLQVNFHFISITIKINGFLHLRNREKNYTSAYLILKSYTVRKYFYNVLPFLCLLPQTSYIFKPVQQSLSLFGTRAVILNSFVSLFTIPVFPSSFEKGRLYGGNNGLFILPRAFHLLKNPIELAVRIWL